MQLPDSVKAIRARYVAQYPVPQGAPGEAFEETARQWSIRFAEQVAHELGPMWGMKRADPNRPISKDTLSFYADDTIRIWDLLTGTGTGAPRLVENPESEDITGQVFVPVTPTNHLGTVQPPVTTPPTLPPADLGPVMERLNQIGQTQTENAAALAGALELIGHLIGASAREEQERHAAVMAALAALEAKELHVTLPDGTLRIAGRAAGVVDFPGN